MLQNLVTSIAGAALLGGAMLAVPSAASPAGALIQMTSSSTVGVLLDEIPAGPLREAAAANALAKSSDFWIARAKDQVRLMSYRLIFRSGFHNTSSGTMPNSYGPLPLPPQRDKWKVTLNG